MLSNSEDTPVLKFDTAGRACATAGRTRLGLAALRRREEAALCMATMSTDGDCFPPGNNNNQRSFKRDPYATVGENNLDSSVRFSPHTDIRHTHTKVLEVLEYFVEYSTARLGKSFSKTQTQPDSFAPSI